MRHIGFVLAVFCLVGAGCKKTEPSRQASLIQSTNEIATPIQPKEIVARIHWGGKRQVAADTNFHDLMAIWNLPASIKLEAQTLDKLSTAPWRLGAGELKVEDGGSKIEDTSSNKHSTLDSQSALLRPLLEDLLQEESYFEMACATNEPEECAFAIKLSRERAALWQTNLAAILKSLTGRFSQLKITRVGDWTLISHASPSPKPGTLLASFQARIQRDRVPFTASTTNYWLTADLDIQQIVRSLAPTWKLPAMTPTVSLTVTGNGEFVRTRGQLKFPEPLRLDLEPWNVPTNLIHGDATTFTAVRGFKSWLGLLDVWKHLQIGEAPNQMFLWGFSGIPVRNYLAIPSVDASNRVEQISDLIVEKSSVWFATNELAGFRRSDQFSGLEWQGLPYLYPFIKREEGNYRDYVLAGSVLLKGDEGPLPIQLVQGLFSRTNLVYYDREFTGGQIEQWIYLSQFMRYVTYQIQLPQDSVGLLWLKAIEPITGSSATDITWTDPAQLSFARTSGAGFTAIELNLLADWLESPDFPLGLHTFSATQSQQ